MTTYRFQVFADYHQFYVWDGGANPSPPIDYTDTDLRNRVKVAPNVVVIQPMRNMTVPVELDVCSSDPGVELPRWDHVAECSLDLPTGKLQVHECTGGAILDLSVAPGTYRLRAHFGGLGLLSDDGLEGGCACVFRVHGSPVGDERTAYGVSAIRLPYARRLRRHRTCPCRKRISLLSR